MALTPQDQNYYEEKLGVSGYLPVFIATLLIGAIMWPLLLYLMDWSAGDTSKWSGKVITNLMTIGFLLGSVVGIVMNLIFRFLLWMGWLPARH